VAFSDDEIAYLQSQPVARLATVNADGQPDVVPVAFELDGPYIWVGGVGPDVAKTRKLRNIGAGRTKVSLVVDDLVSMEPSSPGRCGCTGTPSRRSNAWAWSGRGSIAASPRRCRGAGIWLVSPRVSGGTPPNVPCTTRDLR
jgi:PPOX class F420-dependent enzyme/OxyR family protein